MNVATAVLVVGLAFVGVLYVLGSRGLEAYRRALGADEPGEDGRVAEGLSGADPAPPENLDDLDDEEAAGVINFVRNVDYFTRMSKEQWIEEQLEAGAEPAEIEAMLKNREPLVLF